MRCCDSDWPHPTVVVQSLSCVQLFATPWTTRCQTSQSTTNFQSLLKLMSVESVMPFNHLALCHSLLLLLSVFPSIRVFSSKSTLHTRWPKYWHFGISPSNEYSGLISFRIDWLYCCCPMDPQESSPELQFESINCLTPSLLYGPTLTFIHAYWKNHSFDLCGQCGLCFLIRCLSLS